MKIRYDAESDVLRILFKDVEIVDSTLGSDDVEVTGITAAGMRPACAFLDEAGKPVYAGPNSDARGVGQALDLMRPHADAIHAITGQLPPLVTWPARMLWFRDNDPGTLRRIRGLVSLEGWVLTLFGARATMDPSAASATGLFDLRVGEWSAEMCGMAGWDPNELPRIARSGTEVGRAKGDLAEALGHHPLAVSEHALLAVGDAVGGHDGRPPSGVTSSSIRENLPLHIADQASIGRHEG
jgi:sugar (pentulose or hexulose) kinase